MYQRICYQFTNNTLRDKLYFPPKRVNDDFILWKLFHYEVHQPLETYCISFVARLIQASIKLRNS